MTAEIIHLATIRKSKPNPVDSKKRQDELYALHQRIRETMHDEYERMKGDYAYVQMDFDDFEKWFVKWTLRVNENKVFVQKVKDSNRQAGKNLFFDDPA